MKQTQVLCLLAALSAGTAFPAGFSYTEKTEMTGGSMKRLIGFAARLGGQKTGPITSTHRFQDNRMMVDHEKTADITDLGSETITQVDREHKTYSTITFAEMAQAMEKMAERMAQAKGKDEGRVKARWSVDFKPSGQTRQVAGVEAKGGKMLLRMEATDASSGAGGAMKIDMDLWMGKVPGYDTAQKFYMEMAKKASFRMGPEVMAMAQAGPGANEGMAEAARKMREMDGMTLFSVMRMYGGDGPGMPGAGAGASSEPPARREGGEEAGRSSGGRFGGLGGALGGRLGGRLGRGKDKEPAPASPESAAGGGPAAPASGDGVLMEWTTEVISFSSEAVDPALFQVPAGFKQVEHPMKKMLSQR